MEKLHSRLTQLLLVVLLFSCLDSTAQKNLIVFKVKGNPILKVNDSLKSLNKGSQITTNASVSLKSNDDLLLINNEGNCFNIKSPNEYNFSEILNHPVAEDNSSFTKKYFTYVWSQLVKNTKSKTKTGVVYRNDNIMLLEPSDSVMIYIPEIEFVWNIEGEKSYFLLKDLESEHITKYGIKGESLTLFVDNKILIKGKSYQWAVSGKKFPNLEEVEFYNFSLLTSEEFKTLKPDIDQFKKELSALGFTSKEIKLMLCKDYKICY